MVVVYVCLLVFFGRHETIVSSMSSGQQSKDIFSFKSLEYSWMKNIIKLVGGLEHFLFFHILGIIIPTDFHIFQRG